MMPKVSLTTKELEILCYYLDWKIMEINETGNEFEYPEVEDIYNKLDGILSACTCKEQKEDWTCKLTHKAELSDQFW